VTSGQISEGNVMPLMLFNAKILFYIFCDQFEGPVVPVLNINTNCNITNICAQFRERTQIYLYF
jgi:hypothetical protein